MSLSPSQVHLGALNVSPLGRPFNVSIMPPGSKSQTNRYLMLAALSSGISTVHRPLRALDTDLFMDALVAMGVPISRGEDSTQITAPAGRISGGVSINLGDGGTPTRFLMAIASLARSPVTIDGSARMRQRPIAEGVEMLRALGASVTYIEEEERLPVRVGGGALPRGGVIEVGRTASSQFVSALLLLAPRLERGVDLFVTQESLTTPSYIELTLDAMRSWGVQFDVLRDARGRLTRITVPPAPLAACSRLIEPDASSAVYFLAAAAIVRDARVTIRGLPRLSTQPDAACLRALISMGAHEWSSPRGMGLEGTATLNGVDLDGSHWPDGALCIAAVASMAKGRTRIRGLETLKVKESNRIQVLAEEFAKIGTHVETTEHSIVIDPEKSSPRPGVIDPRGDHRIAMTFAVLGLVRPGISIADPGCVAKSYPNFWSDFGLLAGPQAG
ncbi:MAG: 3-phosphoshikimate 1-carboxyvinyltransferase [Phycisphaerales bacterium]|nr:3-phosphoshikimate 1-carboxyvinyltransferase [Phycisphaerales bacterium]